MKLVVLVVMLASVARVRHVATTSSDGVCPRWSCPCVQSQRHAVRLIANKRLDPTSNFRRTALSAAREALQLTRNVLRRIETERFGGRADHVVSLHNCAQSIRSHCAALHLQQCQMEGFPSMYHVERLHHHSSEETLITEALRLLSIMAVYVEQARRDEANISDVGVSLAPTIELIENAGIYQLLCELQMSATNRRLSWDPSVERNVRLIGCAFEVQAPKDNRNYIVFYTLEKLLRALIRNY